MTSAGAALWTVAAETALGRARQLPLPGARTAGAGASLVAIAAEARATASRLAIDAARGEPIPSERRTACLEALLRAGMRALPVTHPAREDDARAERVIIGGAIAIAWEQLCAAATRLAVAMHHHVAALVNDDENARHWGSVCDLWLAGCMPFEAIAGTMVVVVPRVSGSAPPRA